MAITKKKAALSKPEPFELKPEFEAAPLSMEPAPTPATSARRMSFPVDEDGVIQWQSMRPSTAAELKAIFKQVLEDASFTKELGLAPQPVIEIFDEGWCGTIYDALGAVESVIAQKLYGIPPEIAREVFTYSEIEKQKLAGPTVKVINKYATKYDWLVRFKEEIALGMLLTAITTVKFRIAAARAEIWAKQTKAASKPNGKDAAATPAAPVEQAAQAA